MLGRIFYNVIVLGTIISICIFPVLVFLSKNKYRYNFKSIYKVFAIVLLVLFIPINTIKFSEFKNIFKKEEIANIPQNIEETHVSFKTENMIIEVDKDINVKSDTVFNISKILPYIWITITLSLFGYNLISYIAFIIKEKRSFINSNNSTVDKVMNMLCKDMNLNRVSYKISENISTPMTVGLFNKKIIISKDNLDERQYEIILRHEMFHIKNKDIEFKFILLVLNCIYWFNPIIYLFTNQVDELLELNCDENVLKNKDNNFRTEYAKILLNQIEINRNKQYRFSMNFANRRKNIMRRFSSIVNDSKKKSVAVIASVTAVLLITSILLIVLVPNINFATIQESIEEKNNIENNEVEEEEVILDINDQNLPENIGEDDDKDTSEITKEVDKDIIENVIVEDNTSNIEPIQENEIEETETKLISTSITREKNYYDIGLNGYPLKEYSIEERFGNVGGGSHTGIDLKADEGAEIYSVADGRVDYAGWKGSYGYMIVISHADYADSIQTFYAHCKDLYVEVGQEVKQGQVIASVGSTGNSTGPHLHLELRLNGRAVNPEEYLSL